MAFRSYDDMNEMFEQMDAMFEQMRRNWMMTPGLDAGMGTAPALESGSESGLDRRGRTATSLTEEDGTFVFAMDLPGFETEDIDLSYRDGYLYVEASTQEESDSEFASMRQSRRTSERVFVPRDVVLDEIAANYRNGVLEVRLPIDESADDDSGHHIAIED